jgi:hypothetical protein
MIAKNIWEMARIRAGQTNTTVEEQLSRLGRAGSRSRERKKNHPPAARNRFESDWAKDLSKARNTCPD